jgi:hypothetical protein
MESCDSLSFQFEISAELAVIYSLDDLCRTRRCDIRMAGSKRMIQLSQYDFSDVKQ